MKSLKITMLITSLAVMWLAIPALAEMATKDEALTVAKNWVNLIVRKTGAWGDSNTPVVRDIQEFKRGERTIGYFCSVQPKGYIVISLRKELAPVKACSETCDLDPQCDQGMSDLIKGRMERILDKIEKKVGPIHLARTEDVSKLLEINYRRAWTALEADAATSEREGGEATNYQAGDVLLTSSWYQGDPYNRQCPSPPSGDDCDQPRCVVGCVATAGAQIMRYWCWPPFGVGYPYDDPYDWVYMPDFITAQSPAAHINAVANLCREVGEAVGMDYCGGEKCASTADTSDMEGVYENQFRYDTYCVKLDRSDYSASGWFNEIVIQISNNQPIHYRVPGHSIVADGWRIVTGIQQYHMNYGWGGGKSDKPCWPSDITNSNTWYTLDGLPCSDPTEEYMLVNIFPVQSVRHAIGGTYPRLPFNYRYFNQDATGSGTFEAGQYLQFLPRITVTSTGLIQFKGTSSDGFRFFTRGDVSKGINVGNGGINLYAGGSIKLY